MRLVIDGRRLSAGRTGVGRCLESLLASWAESGWPLDETVLVARDPRGLDRVPDDPDLSTVVIGENWPGLVWEEFGLGRVLKHGDLLFAPANLVPLSWKGPTVAVLYDTLPWSAPKGFPWHVRLRFDWRYRLAARRATRVVVPSLATARDVARVHGISNERIRVVYPGPEPGFRPRLPDAPEVVAARRAVGLGEEPFFLFVGKRSRRRNVPSIIAAFAAHRQRFPSHRLIFAGPAGGDCLPGTEIGVINAGHVPEETLHGLLADALALLYPSDHEGFGLPIVEAQASGCPVVTLRNSALIESGGDGAIFLDSAHPAEIARALEFLSTDRISRADIIARGLVNVARFRRSDFAVGIKEEIRLVAGLSGERADPGRFVAAVGD